MAYTLNGIGTAFYGKRDFCADGTYITTEWITVLYIPLVPLRSMRVRYQGRAEPRFSIGVGSAETYAVFEKTAPRLKQVLFTYGYTWFLITWTSCLISLIVSFKDPALAFSTLSIGLLLPMLIPWLLRYPARHRLQA